MKKKSQLRRPYVAILVDTSTTWGNGIVRGIFQWMAEHGRWLIHVEPSGRFEQPRLPKGWRGDGILARVTTREYARHLRRPRAPIVNVSSHDPTEGRIAHCSVDIDTVGRLAAEHFLERGFAQFAYVGTAEPRDQPVNLQYRGFADAVAKVGHQVEVLEPGELLRRGKRGDALSPELARWLCGLAKPVGILTWSAAEGRRVAEACKLSDIRVPEEAAIVAGEYDELICDLSSPPLSAVEYSSQTVGHRAAELLDGLMRGKKQPTKPVLIQPKNVFTRQSSDIVAIDNPRLARAISFIREHALDGINVGDVLGHVRMGRRTLEQQFQETLGRSPAEEIRYIRLQHASKLLEETDWTLARVARASGFSNRNIFARSFEREHGASPSEFRSRFRRSRR